MITKLNFTDRTIKSYAIRKLTPKECFRLMGVRDNVIGTMQSSNAQAAERLPDWKGSDTRSALLWRVADAVEVLRPKYLLQENVAALVSQKFMPDFQKSARQTLVARLCEPLGATQRKELWCATKPRPCILYFHAP